MDTTVNDIHALIDRVVKKAFEVGFEAGAVAAIDPSHDPEKMTFTYYREELMKKTWDQMKSKLTP